MAFGFGIGIHEQHDMLLFIEGSMVDSQVYLFCIRFALVDLYDHYGQ